VIPEAGEEVAVSPVPGDVVVVVPVPGVLVAVIVPGVLFLLIKKTVPPKITITITTIISIHEAPFL
jgi:hypothetical protein